jgi:polysaccharide biosynthesis/export protein
MEIESHLSQHLDDPEIAVEIFSYNSKVYYVVTEGAGMGDQIIRIPFTGNETVLDAMSNIGGMSSLSSKHIWIARPTPYSDQIQILPIDWVAITKQGSTMTNYQILPGDRLFIAENDLVALDTNLGKMFAPIERIMGFSVLTLGVARTFSGKIFGGGRRGIGDGGGAIIIPGL